MSRIVFRKLKFFNHSPGRSGPYYLMACCAPDRYWSTKISIREKGRKRGRRPARITSKNTKVIGRLMTCCVPAHKGGRSKFYYLNNKRAEDGTSHFQLKILISKGNFFFSYMPHLVRLS